MPFCLETPLAPRTKCGLALKIKVLLPSFVSGDRISRWDPISMSIDNHNTQADDEIDLKELALTLWRGRKLIALCVVSTMFLASAYLWVAERKYTVTYTFQPVATEDSGPNFSGLGGLASLAGVSLPTGGSTDFQAFQMLLQSEETAEDLLKKDDLAQRIFADEWDAEDKTFAVPSRSVVSLVLGPVKTVLTGQSRPDYIPPNPARLAEWLGEAFSKSEDRDTGFLKLSAEHEDPELIVDVMIAATKSADKIIRDRFLASGQETVDFYQRKLVSARSREHKEALAQLIAQEEQKLMLASRSGYFVAKPLTTPSVSLQPTSPKASLVLALSIVLGGFVGAALALIRKALQND